MPLLREALGDMGLDTGTTWKCQLMETEIFKDEGDIADSRLSDTTEFETMNTCLPGIHLRCVSVDLAIHSSQR